MAASVLPPTPLRGNLFCGVALLLVASIGTAGAAQWAVWEPTAYPQSTQATYGGSQSTGSPQQQWGDGTLPYSREPGPAPAVAGKAASLPSAPYSRAPQKPIPSAFATQEFSLDDLPVDAESTAASPRSSPAGEGAPGGKKQKSSFVKVLKNFFKHPAPHKIILLILVLVGAWLLSGLIAKLVIMGLSGFVFFKLLQFFEENQSTSQ